MSKKIVNLTRLLVVEEIEKHLANFPDEYPNQSTFSLPDLRQELTAFVLKKVPQHYTVMEDSQGEATFSNLQGCLSEQRSQIKDLIEKGTNQIIQDTDKSVVETYSQKANLVTEPSHWFG